MKRSEINKLIQEAIEFFNSQNFHLPPWGYWTAEDWYKNRHDAKGVVEHKLGLDLTDGDYYNLKNCSSISCIINVKLDSLKDRFGAGIRLCLISGGTCL